MPGKVIVTISKDGSQATTKVEGIPGQKCTDVTKGLIDALGQIEKSEKTPDYFLVEQDVVHDHGS